MLLLIYFLALPVSQLILGPVLLNFEPALFSHPLSKNSCHLPFEPIIVKD